MTKTRLEFKDIIESLSHHTRRRAFLATCESSFLTSLIDECKALIAQREQEEKERQQAIQKQLETIEAVKSLLAESGVPIEAFLESVAAKSKAQTPARVIRRGYKLPESDAILYWSGRGRMPVPLKKHIDMYGKDSLKDLLVSE